MTEHDEAISITRSEGQGTLPMSEGGWGLYLAALTDYRREPSPEALRALIDAYSSWGAEFGLSPTDLHIEVERFHRALMAEQRKRAA